VRSRTCPPFSLVHWCSALSKPAASRSATVASQSPRARGRSRHVEEEFEINSGMTRHTYTPIGGPAERTTPKWCKQRARQGLFCFGTVAAVLFVLAYWPGAPLQHGAPRRRGGVALHSFTPMLWPCASTPKACVPRFQGFQCRLHVRRLCSQTSWTHFRAGAQRAGPEPEGQPQHNSSR
jgi:hypothetical protein